ncbi:hypothetical protein [Streptomyces marianii]|uniref:Uncharacterized protein n=1 Tax=Streptomyces marianii TaxID=1817406 RepID=A0A5R9DTC1_9ACTN|nr:hypothetical protein [Streptomyces marianii]TLQ39346.1 hypothetical protein FEF34_38855 [Streptomyces marianii]
MRPRRPPWPVRTFNLTGPTDPVTQPQLARLLAPARCREIHGILADFRVDINDDREYKAMLEQIRTLGAGLALAREEDVVTSPRTPAAAVTARSPESAPHPVRLHLPFIETGKKLTDAAREKFAKKVAAAYRSPGRTVTFQEICDDRAPFPALGGEPR